MPDGISFSATSLKHLNAAITRARARVSHLERLRNVNLGRTVIICGKCAAEHQIRAIVYIQTHWYVRPSGCNDGDYYRSGEGNWDCLSCGARNRLYNKPDITELKRLFKSERACYCDDFSLCSDPNPCKECKGVGATKHGTPISGAGSLAQGGRMTAAVGRLKTH